MKRLISEFIGNVRNLRKGSRSLDPQPQDPLVAQASRHPEGHLEAHGAPVALASDSPEAERPEENLFISPAVEHGHEHASEPIAHHTVTHDLAAKAVPLSFHATEAAITLEELQKILSGPEWSKLMRNALDGGATSILACRILDKTMTLLQHGYKHVEMMVDAAQNVRTTTVQLATISDDIKQVSNQTRLVSINAGIEANRAGEAGKTFLVVAQEMTQLSEDTRNLTLSIDAKLVNANEKIAINRELCGKVGKLFGDMNKELDEFRKMMMRVEELSGIQVEQLGTIEKILTDPSEKKRSA